MSDIACFFVVITAHPAVFDHRCEIRTGSSKNNGKDGYEDVDWPGAYLDLASAETRCAKMGFTRAAAARVELPEGVVARYLRNGTY